MNLLIISENPFLVDAIETGLACYLPAVNIIGKCFSIHEGMDVINMLQVDIILIDASAIGKTKHETIASIETKGS